MFTINLKSRFRNKAFLVSMVGAIVLLIQNLGFKDIIPTNYLDIVNSILTILTMGGIVVDTSTKGLSDNITAIETNTADSTNSTGSTTDAAEATIVDIATLQAQLAEANAKIESVTNLINPQA